MEWDAKTPSPWDWDNLGLFCGKLGEAPKLAQPQLGECRAEAAMKFTNGGGGGISIYPSYGSGSELGNGCSSKSTISASLDSSGKLAIRAPEVDFEAIEGLPKIHNKSRELSARIEDTGTSPAVVGIVNHKEPIGLKLGKRTYFEDVCTGNSNNYNDNNNNNNNNFKNSSPSASAAQPSVLLKKSRTTQQSTQNSYCQVEGCSVDLTNAKDYHRKHRVCENHSKSPKVVVAGHERRFCQQCSRFHELSEFDQKKRSCRRRLSDHNARRRKPQPDTISFNSGRTVSFYDNRQQMNLLWNCAPFENMKPNTISAWEGSCDFKFTQARESWVKPPKDGVAELHFPNEGMLNHVTATKHEPDRLMAFKGTNTVVLSQGPGASAVASNMEGERDLRRALSLLSTDSWGSSETGPASVVHFPTNNLAASETATLQASTCGYWQGEQPALAPQQARMLSFNLHNNANQLQEFQLLKSPFETAFFDSSSIH